MKHLYKCSHGHLFQSEENDIEASCTVTDGSVQGQCFLMGWHLYEDCRCLPPKDVTPVLKELIQRYTIVTHPHIVGDEPDYTRMAQGRTPYEATGPGGR